jgi:hypothetical protein
VKVSTNTRRYLILFNGGICVKPNCQSMAGRHPLAWWIGKGEGLILELGFVHWQIGLGNRFKVLYVSWR